MSKARPSNLAAEGYWNSKTNSSGSLIYWGGRTWLRMLKPGGGFHSMGFWSLRRLLASPQMETYANSIRLGARSLLGAVPISIFR